MVVVLKSESKREEVELFIDTLENKRLQVDSIDKKNYRILNLLGNTEGVNVNSLDKNNIVKEILDIKEPFKKSHRYIYKEDSVFNILGNDMGGEKIALIAGPCSVESEDQIRVIGHEVKKCGANFLRGGAFKPRTSPYSFQGLGLQGLEFLKLTKEKTGLPIVTEIMSLKYLDKFVEDVDIIQVGSRNMQNFELLKELGKIDKPILLKRGLAATIEEFLMAAEYIMAGGNERVILCERGIRTFDTYTRNTLDIGAIPVIKKLSHLPIIIDPSHACGKNWMIDSLSKAAIAAGADGLIIEVHNKPHKALSDGEQSITPAQYKKLVNELKPIAYAVGRKI